MSGQKVDRIRLSYVVTLILQVSARGIPLKDAFEEVAEHTGLTPRVVEDDWEKAQVLLFKMAK